MNVHGPALKLHTTLTQRRILSDSAFHAHNAFKYYLSTEDSNGQCRIEGQGGCALSSSLLYLCIILISFSSVYRTVIKQPTQSCTAQSSNNRHHRVLHPASNNQHFTPHPIHQQPQSELLHL